MKDGREVNAVPISLAMLKRLATNLRGQRLLPGIRAEGYDAPYLCFRLMIKDRTLFVIDLAYLSRLLFAQPLDHIDGRST